MSQLTLTIREIKDLAEFAGLVIDDTEVDKDELDLPITIGRGNRGVQDAPGSRRLFYNHIAWFSDFPEEGVRGLGPLKKAPRRRGNG